MVLAGLEVCAAATVDPETALIDAPGVVLDTGRATDLPDEASIAASTDVAVVSFAVVGGTGDDASWWWGWRSATTDGEFGTAAAVDPEAAAVNAPGIALDTGRAADLSDEANIAAAADVAVVPFAVVGGAGDLRWGAVSLAVPLLRMCG